MQNSLEKKGAIYKEIAIDKDTDESKKAMEFMSSKELNGASNNDGNKLLSGYDDLQALENDNQLDCYLYQHSGKVNHMVWCLE